MYESRFMEPQNCGSVVYHHIHICIYTTAEPRKCGTVYTWYVHWLPNHIYMPYIQLYTYINILTYKYINLGIYICIMNTNPYMNLVPRLLSYFNITLVFTTTPCIHVNQGSGINYELPASHEMLFRCHMHFY